VNVASHTRTAHLIGLAGIVLLLASCTDRQEATAPNAQPKTFDATVATVVTARAKDGTAKELQFIDKVRTTFRAGQAREMVVVDNPGDPGSGGCGTSCSTQPMTPVLFVPTGDLWSNYDETVTDSQGNLVRVVATGPADGSPVDEVWVWVNGAPAIRMSSTWRAVYGGYTLATQTITGFTRDLYPAIRFNSVVGGTTTISSNSSPLVSQFAAALGSVGCWLAPTLAYAETSGCTRQWLVLAGETFGLGVGTYFFPELFFIHPIAIGGAYITAWGTWTSSLYDALHCQSQQHPKPKRPSVPEPKNLYGF
jgi:hypothetical protein